MHSAAQVLAWRPMTEAVQAAGSTIFAQLMHTGRVGHPSLLPDGLSPVGPSAVAAAAQTFTPEGLRDFLTPEEPTRTGITTPSPISRGRRPARASTAWSGTTPTATCCTNFWPATQICAPTAGRLDDIVETGHREVYRALTDAIEPLGPAYLHVAEMDPHADRAIEIDCSKRRWSVEN
nr:hypothetical protein [Nocardia cyriacigeorgica]